MNSDRKKLVVTGASGFLGSHLVERLKDDGRFAVFALSSQAEALQRRIGGGNIEYLHRDALLDERAGSIVPGAIIVNCAYPRASTGTAIAGGLEYIRGVFEAAVDNGARAIVNISSQSVYSPQRTEAATERTPVSLESPYAVGKYAVELMLESICRNRDTAYTSIRMASLIGPGFDQRIVNRFVKQALETGRLSVKRNEQRFGFLDIRDAVDGLVAMLGSEVCPWQPVYNLGGKGTYTLVEIAETVKNVVEGSHKAGQVAVIEGEAMSNSEIDGQLYASTFGYEARYSLADSVRWIVAHFCRGYS